MTLYDEALVAQIKNELEDSHQRATSYDVARAAQVSQSAVSRCFKEGASVSTKMRDRVKAVADELGYQPNAIARSLITRRSNIVAVVINNDANLHYPELLTELSRGFKQRGVHMLLFTLETESDVSAVLSQIWQYQVDGVILAAQVQDDDLKFIAERNIPFVYYNRMAHGVSCNSVNCDNEEGERLLVDLLYAEQRRHFCIVTGPKDSAVSANRMKSALSHLSEVGINDVKVVNADHTYQSGYDAIVKLINDTGWTPDAIICANDIMALGCIDALRNVLDLSVPEDVAVVGFDGTAVASWDAYQLTTVAQPIELMTEAAVSILMQRISNPELPPEKRVFSGVLRNGNTTK